MSIYFNKHKIFRVYFNKKPINSLYFDRQKIFQSSGTPWVLFEFPTGVNPNSNTSNKHGIWVHVSTSPNRWKWYCDAYWSENIAARGWIAAFSSQTAPPVPTLTTDKFAYVHIIAIGGDLSKVTSTDRMFAGCDAITEIPDMSQIGFEPTITAGMFSDCVNVTTGAYDLYDYLSNLPTPPTNKSGMFTNCGSNTQTGAAELAQIPVAWGGTYVPPAVNIEMSLDTNKYSWTITNAGGIDFETDMNFSIFTSESVSQYPGVNMKRSAVKWKGGSAIASTTQIYYYPVFFQGVVSGSQPTMTYIMLTQNWNGSLPGGTAQGDMSGTLDYTALGPYTYKTGTYNANSDVHFGFFVCQYSETDLANMSDLSTLLTGKWGLLSNNYFKAQMILKYLTTA